MAYLQNGALQAMFLWFDFFSYTTTTISSSRANRIWISNFWRSRPDVEELRPPAIQVEQSISILWYQFKFISKVGYLRTSRSVRCLWSCIVVVLIVVPWFDMSVRASDSASGKSQFTQGYNVLL